MYTQKPIQTYPAKAIANCKKSDCISDLKLKTPGDSRLEQSITL
ncbi:hypothetical protein [Escherichia phage phi456]|uniref:Uncharacterized protein n=2 Tax=root TaxID=1 RepID=A0A160HRF7_ECOLX|nr:hypothetical protein [Escherichia coli]AXI37853.1 Hypothetical protein FORC64_p024 [Escherichia coli]WNL49382.1 hypothetical protein [Escherichia phage phi456]